MGKKRRQKQFAEKLEVLRARLETGGSALKENAQLETISETEESPESLAADGTNPQEVSEESTAEAAQVERIEEGGTSTISCQR